MSDNKVIRGAFDKADPRLRFSVGLDYEIMFENEDIVLVRSTVTLSGESSNKYMVIEKK